MGTYGPKPLVPESTFTNVFAQKSKSRRLT